jgi:hypothetical protein
MTDNSVTMNLCPDYDSAGSHMRMPCSKCKTNHPARFGESQDDQPSDLQSVLSAILAASTVKLPKRPDKVPLTEYQKQAIKAWIMPSGTFSKKCDYCGKYYSSGYLNICNQDPTQFCRSRPYEPPQPRGYSDDELGFYFGITRDELDKK